MSSASAIERAIQKKFCGQKVMRAEIGITLIISNEDLAEIIRIIKSLQKSGLSFDGISQTVKNKIRKTRKLSSWYVIMNFVSFNVREYGNWKRSIES